MSHLNAEGQLRWNANRLKGRSVPTVTEEVLRRVASELEAPKGWKPNQDGSFTVYSADGFSVFDAGGVCLRDCLAWELPTD